MNTDEGQPSGPTNDPRFLMTLMMPSALTSAGRLTSRKGESAGGKGTSAGGVGCVCSARQAWEWDGVEWRIYLAYLRSSSWLVGEHN